jgi:hypothetical protein
MAYVTYDLCLAELLDGQSIAYPRHTANMTIRRPPRARGRGMQQMEIRE